MKLHWVSMAYIPRHPHDSNNQGAISHHPRLGLWLRGGSWHYQVDQTRIHPKTPIPSYSYCEIRHHVARRWIFSCHPGPTKKILSTEIPRAQGWKKSSQATGLWLLDGYTITLCAVLRCQIVTCQLRGNWQFWVAVSTSPKNFKAGMRKFAFFLPNIARCHICYCPTMATTCQQDFSFNQW